MNRKTWLAIGLTAFVLIILCIGVASVGFIGYEAYQRLNTQGLSPSISGGQPVEPPPTQVNTPIGADIDLAALFSPFWEARTLLHDNFVQQPIDEAVLAQGALDGLTATLEAAGIDLAELELPADAPAPEELAAEAGSPVEIAAHYEEFWLAWEKATYADLGADLSYEILMQESLRGLVASLGDRHTSYMNPDEFYQTQVSLDGNYEGIGAWVDPSAEYLTIIAPMDGSPAEAAGLLPGDQVLAVDGDDMTGIDGNLVIRRVLGPAGSDVILTIGRDGVTDPFDVTITRARIVIPTTRTEMLEGNIAYLQLYNFGADSTQEFRNALESLLAENPDGLILDLRNNGGGYLHAAVSITSEFLPRGELVLLEEFGDGSRQEYTSHGNGLALEIPVVILVNQGSASATEILAGALQDYGRAFLVGEVTFGKGSVQLPLELSDQQGALRITIARWLTPLDRHIQDLGLAPDHLIPLTEEDVEFELDPQLDFALDLLTAP